jgi:hypothetical protein
VRVLENKLAQLEDGGEVGVHLLLEFGDLLLGHLVLGVVEDLLAQNFQDFKVVLANVHVLNRRVANVCDE